MTRSQPSQTAHLWSTIVSHGGLWNLERSLETTFVLYRHTEHSSGQEERFHQYVSDHIYEKHFGVKDRGPTVDSRRSPDSPSIPDPRDVYDESALEAGEMMRIQPSERADYFARHNVEDVRVTIEQPFEEVAPPIPEDMLTAHEELNRGAHERSELRGEWLVFPKRRTVGSIWQRTLELVNDGTLYDAQVSTAWHHESRGERSERYYFGLALLNYFEVADVYRVGQVIRSEGIVGDGGAFFLKPLLYTRPGSPVGMPESTV